MTDSLLDAGLADIIALGQIGLGLVNERQIVIERHGALAAWMPPEGSPLCSCPIMFGMADALKALPDDKSAPLRLAATDSSGRERRKPVMPGGVEVERTSLSRWHAVPFTMPQRYRNRCVAS